MMCLMHWHFATLYWWVPIVPNDIYYPDSFAITTPDSRYGIFQSIYNLDMAHLQEDNLNP